MPGLRVRCEMPKPPVVSVVCRVGINPIPTLTRKGEKTVLGEGNFSADFADDEEAIGRETGGKIRGLIDYQIEIRPFWSEAFPQAVWSAAA